MTTAQYVNYTTMERHFYTTYHARTFAAKKCILSLFVFIADTSASESCADGRITAHPTSYFPYFFSPNTAPF